MKHNNKEMFLRKFMYANHFKIFKDDVRQYNYYQSLVKGFKWSIIKRDHRFKFSGILQFQKMVYHQHYSLHR